MTFGALALASLLTSCKAPDVAVGTQVSIIKVESTNRASGLPDSNALNDNATGRSYFPETAQEAATIAHRLISLGHAVDIGLGQYDFTSQTRGGLTVEDALDPCINVYATGKFLEGCWLQAFKAVGYDRRREREADYGTAACYNSGSIFGDEKYINDVVNASRLHYVRRVVILYQRLLRPKTAKMKPSPRPTTRENVKVK